MAVLKNNLCLSLLLAVSFAGCASTRSIFGLSASDHNKAIANPFGNSENNPKDSVQNIVLRSKSGDRSIEVELPGDTQSLSDFVIPISSDLKGSNRTIASVNGNAGPDINDESYKTKLPSVSDREITSAFSHGTEEDQGRILEIEKGLNLSPNETGTFNEGDSSYLAAVDHIKQLYRSSRYEVALLETDEMIRKFQTDPRLYEMRGTLLDRLGKKELAMKSWNQALHFSPTNQKLKKFIDRKHAQPNQGVL